MRVLLCLIMLTFLLGVEGNGCAKQNDHVLWVHGYDGSGCSGVDLEMFRNAIEHFRANDWDARMDVVSYYDCDETWSDAGLDVGWFDLNDGSSLQYQCAHDTHHASGHSSDAGCNGIKKHTRQTSIRHLGYHLAWEIYRRFTSQGKRVRIMAHSMGGLITRYAMQMVDEQHPDFPPELNVRSVGNFGTPHDGGDLAFACHLFPCPTQAEQMKRGSSFLDQLTSPLPSNVRVGDTKWWLYGAQDDDQVSVESALKPSGAVDTEYDDGQGIEHGDYFDETSTSLTYRCKFLGIWWNTCRSPMHAAQLQLSD